MVNLDPTEDQTYLHSSCSQEPPDGLHPASGIEIVKLGLPCHNSSSSLPVNLDELDHRGKLRFTMSSPFEQKG